MSITCTVFPRGAGRRLAVAAVLAAVLAVPAAAQDIACAPRGVAPTAAWQIVPLPQSSLVYARDGSLIGEIGLDWRTSISIRTLPRYVGEAFIAIEDKRFYQHDGVDLVGIAGALKDAVRGDVRGASTITQQLVGNMHPDQVDRRDRSIGRKLREQAAAREMERHYNKQQILEAFLNSINFGHRWCGIEAASRHYFGKSASQLTLAEAASLASLPRSPSGYDPIRHPDRNKARRDLVLSRMADQGYITKAQAEQAQREPVVTAPNAGMSAPSPYFVDAVKDIIERAGVPLSAGGYRVYTTLDPALERAATDALVNGTARVEARGDYRHPKFNPAAPQNSDYLQGMVVAVDAATGDVRALVGGRNYSASPFDRAVDGVRQPGSSFKPFVYAKALEDGIPPNAIVPDTALAIPLPNGDIYKPRDDDGKYLGPMTIRDALVGSRNSVAVQLGQMVGMDSVAALAARLGIQTPIRPFPSSAIGATELHPLELVSAYTAFATNGQVVAPRMVMRVEDRTGRVVFGQPPSDPRQVLDPRVAFIVRDMMREVVTRGTGVAARRGVPEGVPIAGKTGTTNDNVDVWFVGMTPQLVAGVWMGFDKPRPIALHVAGGSLAAPVWAEMMSRYYATRSAGQFPAPGGLVLAELDRTSGRLAAPGSPADQEYLEFFLPGTEPAAMRGNPWNVAQWGALLGH